ncbi:MAG: 2-oxoglutarate dehydrogenase E1 component, partial [Saprospiraceae bacterium]
MSNYSQIFNAHPTYIDSMYKNYTADPESVDSGWRVFFQGFEFGSGDSDVSSAISSGHVNLSQELKVSELIEAYRVRGHLLSDTNPIRKRRDRKPFLEAEDFGLTEQDMDESYIAGGAIGLPNAKLSEIIDRLELIYSGYIGFEYKHILKREERKWLQDQIEGQDPTNGYGLSIKKKRR